MMSCDFTLNPFPTSEVIPALLGGAQTPPRVFPLYSQGKKNAENCRKVSLTCSLLERVPEATSCRHGETKFLVVPPNSHVPPHTGQTNTRLVVLMGLNLGEGELVIRLGEEKRSAAHFWIRKTSIDLAPSLSLYITPNFLLLPTYLLLPKFCLFRPVLSLSLFLYIIGC